MLATIPLLDNGAQVAIVHTMIPTWRELVEATKHVESTARCSGCSHVPHDPGKCGAWAYSTATGRCFCTFDRSKVYRKHERHTKSEDDHKNQERAEDQYQQDEWLRTNSRD